MLIYFASDLHLSPETPRITQRFLDFLAGPARHADAIYLLGDIFEYWAGDDDLADPFNARIADALAATTGHGVKIGVIVGNRDFLIGDVFARATGVELLPDPYLLSLPGQTFILSHGDALCTEDLPYQAFRKQVREAAWQTAFLAQPLSDRKRQIIAVRQHSRTTKETTDERLMDVSNEATNELFRRFDYASLIHGHTHHPATHTHLVDDTRCVRWVLADWREEPAAINNMLAWDGNTLTSIPATSTQTCADTQT